MNSISYYKPNGQIDGVVTGDASAIEATIANTHENWIEGAWDGNYYYVKNNKVVEREINPVTLDGLVLHNVPAPCKILINSAEYDVNDETVELDLPMSTKYKVVVKAFPFLDAEFEIET